MLGAYNCLRFCLLKQAILLGLILMMYDIQDWDVYSCSNKRMVESIYPGVRISNNKASWHNAIILAEPCYHQERKTLSVHQCISYNTESPQAQIQELRIWWILLESWLASGNLHHMWCMEALRFCCHPPLLWDTRLQGKAVQAAVLKESPANNST